MSAKSSIEWTDATWNPMVGCTKVSAGCANCYAKRLHDMRHKAFLEGKKMPKQYIAPFEVVQFLPDRLADPLHWDTPRRIFVDSGSDLFHESLAFEEILRVFQIMNRPQCEKHTFQVLTKRIERAVEFFDWLQHRLDSVRTHLSYEPDGMLPRHIWVGTSVEDQARADERIIQLAQIPARVRFLSCEPLLGPLQLQRWMPPKETGLPPSINWVIVGGESGPKARPMEPDWATSIRDQCVRAGVPFFFKQWGEWMPISPNGHDAHFAKLGKRRAGRVLWGREWNEFPGEVRDGR